LLDTRTGNGAPNAPVNAHGTTTVTVTGRAGLPPSGISAVAINVTVAAPQNSGYITAYAAGTTRPTTSNLNFSPGQTVPNLVIAPVSPDGKITLYNDSPGTTHLIADITGYYLTGPPSAAGTFGSVAPTRVLDTRTGNGAPIAPVNAHGTTTVTVASRAGLPPSGISAVAINVTVAAPQNSGYITAYAAGTTRPTTSNLNFSPGQTVPNLVIAPVSPDGKITLYNDSPGTTHLIADITGYYLTGPPSAAGTFGSVAPTRVLDTRTGNGAPIAPVNAHGTTTVTVASRAGLPPSGISAVAINVTVAAPQNSGYITAYAAGTTRPTTSNLNFSPGQTVPNLVIAPVSPDGKITLYNDSPGTTHLIADITGYYLTGAANSAGIRAWGSNGVGQLGDGTTTDRKVPVAVSGLSGVAALAGGDSSGYALLSNGTVRAWGWNNGGQLGDGTNIDRPLPVAVSGLNGVIAIAGGYGSGYALLSNGTVRSWGANSGGQLGDGTTTDRRTPVAVSGLNHVIAIAGGVAAGYALLSNGTVRAWGWNNGGQLGDGTTTDRTLPVAVSGLSGVVAITATYGSGYVLLSNGTVRSWGWNNGGQLGDGSTTNRQVPVAVVGLSDVVAISGGYSAGYALLSNGTVRSWGSNIIGQLGDGTVTDRLTPVAVSGLSGVVGLAGGDSTGYALLSNGTVRAWGWNGYGQLGDGTTTDRFTPVAVSGLSGAIAITGGAIAGYALR
jgi:alpha-tubulin suppressor-like RCC1 family protein